MSAINEASRLRYGKRSGSSNNYEYITNNDDIPSSLNPMTNFEMLPNRFKKILNNNKNFILFYSKKSK